MLAAQLQANVGANVQQQDSGAVVGSFVPGMPNETTLSQLDICLQTYHKALTFDFIAVLLNETQDDPTFTNVSEILKY